MEGMKSMSDASNQDDNQDCVVVRCGGCKRVVYVAVNISRVMDAEQYVEIGRMAARGCAIEHATVTEVRKLKFGCHCRPNKTLEALAPRAHPRA